MAKRTFAGTLVETVEGDITKEQVDAIVNAANESLRGGGGVDGAIHRAGGPAILDECRKLNGCPTGQAKVTTAGKMPAKHVIHTVGPVYRDGNQGEPELLASCFRESLKRAGELSAKTVAFPAISCGVYGYPLPDAARIAIDAIKAEAEAGSGVEHVRFVLFGSETMNAFSKALDEAG